MSQFSFNVEISDFKQIQSCLKWSLIHLPLSSSALSVHWPAPMAPSHHRGRRMAAHHRRPLALSHCTTCCWAQHSCLFSQQPPPWVGHSWCCCDGDHHWAWGHCLGRGLWRCPWREGPERRRQQEQRGKGSWQKSGRWTAWWSQQWRRMLLHLPRWVLWCWHGGHSTLWGARQKSQRGRDQKTESRALAEKPEVEKNVTDKPNDVITPDNMLLILYSDLLMPGLYQPWGSRRDLLSPKSWKSLNTLRPWIQAINHYQF